MPSEWEPDVQKSGQLTICFGTKLLEQAPAWGLNLATRIVEEFNRMAASYQLGVRFVRSLVPPQKNGTGANVLFEASTGACPYISDGKDKEGHLDVRPGHVKGKTFGWQVARTAGPKMHQAFIYVPADPLVEAGVPANTEVKIAISLHEFLHACGLSGEDPGHGHEGQENLIQDLDVFGTDSMIIGQHMFAGGRRVCSDTLQFHLTLRTIGLVQSIWMFGRM
jgi:hypothetical protein